MGIENPSLRALAEKYHNLTVRIPTEEYLVIENPHLRKLAEKYRPKL